MERINLGLMQRIIAQNKRNQKEFEKRDKLFYGGKEAWGSYYKRKDKKAKRKGFNPKNCPNCNVKLKYYHGMLGFEDLRCPKCNYSSFAGKIERY
jgi:Zn-finger nucleic acid-binding protein